MATIEKALTTAAERATTVRIKAVPVEMSEVRPFGAERVPVIPCVCVTEPCDCDGSTIWYLPSDSIREKTGTGTRTSDGDEVFTFYVERDAQILVETISSASAQRLTAPKPYMEPGGPTKGPGGLPPGITVPFSINGNGSLRRLQTCAGHRLWDIYETTDSDGGLVEIYHEVGSC
ncbi:hypothetical protein ACWET9_44180 [Streptomyces sp. NPDC004059]